MTAGKGDRYRPVDPVKWGRGWRRAFLSREAGIARAEERLKTHHIVAMQKGRAVCSCGWIEDSTSTGARAFLDHLSYD